VRKAEHDLEAARLILAGESHCPYEYGLLPLPPAAENSTSRLAHTAGNPGTAYARSGEVAGGSCPAESRPSVPAAQLVAMNPYAVEVRYADDWLEPQREEHCGPLNSLRESETEARRLSRLKC